MESMSIALGTVLAIDGAARLVEAYARCESTIAYKRLCDALFNVSQCFIIVQFFTTAGSVVLSFAHISVWSGFGACASVTSLVSLLMNAVFLVAFLAVCGPNDDKGNFTYIGRKVSRCCQRLCVRKKVSNAAAKRAQHLQARVNVAPSVPSMIPEEDEDFVSSSEAIAIQNRINSTVL